MKFIYSAFTLFTFFLTYSQSYINVKVVDSESNTPISQAKIISDNAIFYSNDDGNVLIPSQGKDIFVSAISYQEIRAKLPLSEIKLSPIYRNIDEVEIKPIDAKNIIEKVLYYYDKNYLVKSTLYNGTYKEKSYIDNSIHKLLVADINLWTLNNKFNYKKDNMDTFVQMNLNDIRFYKTRKNEPNYPFSLKGSQDKNDIKAFVQRFFLYNQLYLMSYYTKDLKISGRIINETGDVQEISFKSENMPDEVLYYEGKMVYNKKDNAIIYLEVNHIQPKAIRSFKNNLDEDLETNTTNFKVSYDFIKENGKYVPAMISMDYIANVIYNSNTYPMVQSKQFIFRTHQESNKKGIGNKIDLSKNITDNIPTKEVKESKILLSNEEQQFIDEH